MRFLHRFLGQPSLRDLPPGRILVAVSGGADSVALLHLCRAAAPKLQWDLVAGHVQHGLRGRDSLRDQRFVEAVCRDLGVDCRVLSVRVPKKNGKFSEEAARKRRYRALAQMARREGASVILTAHTANDQAETFLLNLLRGAGPDGLSGIRPSRALSEITGDSRDRALILARPLLDFERGEIVSVLKSFRAAYREDLSNRDTRYRRNWVRAEVLPLLQKAQPRIVRRIADLSALLQEDKTRRDAELGRMASKVLSRDGKRLDLASFFEYDISLRRMFLHRAFPRQSYRKIAALLGRLTGLKAGKKRTASLRELLKETRFRDETPARAARTPLTVPGTNWCPRWNLKVTGRLLPRVPPSTLYRKPPVRTAYFDADKLGLSARWALRAWAPGDRFRPLGLGGTRKLQDFFTDRKVARGLRGRMPLIEAGGLIRWIPGHRTDEDSKIDGGTRRVIELQIEKA